MNLYPIEIEGNDTSFDYDRITSNHKSTLNCLNHYLDSLCCASNSSNTSLLSDKNEIKVLLLSIKYFRIFCEYDNFT